jgi:hypothetical protein
LAFLFIAVNQANVALAYHTWIRLLSQLRHTHPFMKSDLEITEVMESPRIFAEVMEKLAAPRRAARRSLHGVSFPEPGPNMMCNSRYGDGRDDEWCQLRQ